MLNPCDGVEKLKISTYDATRSKTFDPTDLVKIANCDYEHQEGFPLKLFAMFLAETGARKGEALHMEWDDFSISSRIWTIKEKPGCPTKTKIGWRPKWGKERRIYLSDTALKILESIPKEKSVGHVIIGKRTDPRGRVLNKKQAIPANFIFTVRDEETGLRRRVDDIKRAWHSLLRTAGVGECGFDAFVLHDFRRYKNVISEYVHNMNLQDRSQQLGNSERINARHYSGEVGDGLVQFQGQIQSLTSKNLELEAKLKMLQNENNQLKNQRVS